MEQWRPIPSLPGVLASSLGRIMVAPYRAAMGGGRKGEREYGGTPRFGTWDGARYIWGLRGKTYRVARLVCEAFHGAPPAGAVCMHLSEDARDNRPENLAWGTQKQNLNFPGFLAYCRTRKGDHNPFLKGRAKRSAQ